MARRSIRREMHDKKVDHSKKISDIGPNGKLRITERVASKLSEKVYKVSEPLVEAEVEQAPEVLEKKTEELVEVEAEVQVEPAPAAEVIEPKEEVEEVLEVEEKVEEVPKKQGRPKKSKKKTND